MKTHSFWKKHPPFETHVKMTFQNETLIKKRLSSSSSCLLFLCWNQLSSSSFFLRSKSCPNYGCNNYNHFLKPLDPTQHNQKKCWKPNQIKHCNMSSKLFHIQLLLAHTKRIMLSYSHSKKLTFKIQQKINKL
jgi:hypothetical protein